MSPEPVFDSLTHAAAAASGCRGCVLSETRTTVVFGVGHPSADLMFVGEGPGAEEDRRGEPFVGRAGRLLTGLIEGIGMSRDDVYIANVVKCRPPGNRDPLPAEIDACRPFLQAQVGFVDPKVVVSLGNVATRMLLGTRDGIMSLRGTEHPFGDAVLVPTLHPSAVLRGGGAALARARADFVTVKRVLARRSAGGSAPARASDRETSR